MEVFATTGENILKFLNFAGNSNALVGRKRGNFDSMGEIKVAGGKMIKKVDRGKNAKFVKLNFGFGTKTGDRRKLVHDSLCYHLEVRIKTKTVKKAVLIIGLGALLLSGLVPALSLLLK